LRAVLNAVMNLCFFASLSQLVSYWIFISHNENYYQNAVPVYTSLLRSFSKFSKYRHPSVSAVNWLQQNRALSETALTESHRKVSVQKPKSVT
jgi:hypothetical protein